MTNSAELKIGDRRILRLNDQPCEEYEGYIAHDNCLVTCISFAPELDDDFMVVRADDGWEAVVTFDEVVQA